MTAEALFLFECDGCGATVDARAPGPEAHRDDCPVRRGKIDRGIWEDPSDA